MSLLRKRYDLIAEGDHNCGVSYGQSAYSMGMPICCIRRLLNSSAVL